METYERAFRRPPAWLSRALLSGFIATSVMIVALLLAFGLASALAAQPPVPGTSSQLTMQQLLYGLTNNAVVDLTRQNLYVAIAIHLAGGLIWAVLYGAVFEPRLPGPGWQRGLFFAAVPWLVSISLFLPLVGGGFLGADMNAGALPILGNLVLNLVYGVTLGHVYGPFGDITFRAGSAEEAIEPDIESAVIPSADRASARGLLGGCAVGLAVGALGAVFAQSSVAAGGGPSPMAIVVGSLLIGGAFGALIGSMFGLRPTSRP